MIYRTIKTQILKSIKTKPVTLITGARQVGKSTLCYEIKKEIGFNYVSLDDLRNRQLANEDPEMFLQINKWPLIIDEVQYAPKLFDVIEAIVNKEKLTNANNCGMFILTGSESYELMKGVSESLAGRVSIINVSTLSTREILNKKEEYFSFDPIELNKRSNDFKLPIDEVFNLIVKGTYPELYSNPNLDSDSFYSNYVQTYIERDVSQLINIKNKYKFQNFMQILASLTGEELVYDKLAKAIGVKLETIQSWISILLAADIIYLLQPYNELSLVKRVVKRPKIYFNDTGLACYLLGINNGNILMSSIFKGRFMETYIFNEIKKSFLNNNCRVNFYYYRDNNQNEIDLVILKDGELHFIEAKTGVSFSLKDVKSFSQLSKSNYKKGTSFIICNTETLYKLDENVFVIPITSI